MDLISDEDEVGPKTLASNQQIEAIPDSYAGHLPAMEGYTTIDCGKDILQQRIKRVLWGWQGKGIVFQSMSSVDIATWEVAVTGLFAATMYHATKKAGDDKRLAMESKQHTFSRVLV